MKWCKKNSFYSKTKNFVTLNYALANKNKIFLIFNLILHPEITPFCELQKQHLLNCSDKTHQKLKNYQILIKK